MGRERDLLAKIAALRKGAKTEGERRAAEAAEVEYRYEYYRRLYVDEEEVLYGAFLQKHRIFPPDGGTSDADDDRTMRMLMMSRCLSDSELRRALPDAEGGDA